eukprot:TRINITY_DN1973_c0_g1_i5.p1 TRINITY_DN1973_c0_g1~~TRINITY_DN1973_c0_g1_i5.p1  ORF type:complete len:566 (+),score=73.47 TRINITY_DN1973_c0_g1_i5:43-1698(+)
MSSALLLSAVCCLSLISQDGSPFPLREESLTSASNIIPFDWHLLPFCQGVGLPWSESRNVGDFVTGMIRRPSPYEVRLNENRTCAKLCDGPLTDSDVDVLKKRISEGYQRTLRVGNVASTFPIGVVTGGETILFNHLQINAIYSVKEGRPQLHTLFVLPTNAGSTNCQSSTSSQSYPYLVASDTVSWTYSVSWFEAPEEESPTPQIDSARERGVIQGLAALGFAMTCFGLAAGCLIRSSLLSTSSIADDVFRIPPFPVLLCSFLCSGVQLLVSLSVVVACLDWFQGWFDRSVPGGLITSYCMSGLFSGCFGVRKLRQLHQQITTLNLFLVSVLSVIPFFFMWLLLDVFLFYEGSSAFVSPMTAMGIVEINTIIMVGCGRGFLMLKIAPSYELPKPVLEEPLDVHVPWYYSVYPALSGVLPFLTIWSEATYLMDEVWIGEGIPHTPTMIAFVGFILTCALSSSAATCIKLQGQDHRWWWSSFYCTGSVGLYFFFFAVVYFVQKLPHLTSVGALLYFVIMFLASYSLFILAGSIGFCASFTLVWCTFGRKHAP